LEADLRRPMLAQQLDVRSEPGLSNVLIGAMSLRSATQVVGLDSPSVAGSARRTLDVLEARAVPRPTRAS